MNTFLLYRELRDNPLVCDCHISWIFQLPDTITIQNAVCMEPESLQGNSLLSETVLSQVNQTCPGIIYLWLVN